MIAACALSISARAIFFLISDISQTEQNQRQLEDSKGHAEHRRQGASDVHQRDPVPTRPVTTPVSSPVRQRAAVRARSCRCPLAPWLAVRTLRLQTLFSHPQWHGPTAVGVLHLWLPKLIYRGHRDGAHPPVPEAVVPGHVPAHAEQERHQRPGAQAPARGVLQNGIAHEAQADAGHGAAR